MKILTALLGLLMSTQAMAAIYGYDAYLPSQLNEFFGLVEKREAGAEVRYSPAQCAPMYRGLIKDGVLDIRYSLGYFDDSATGKEVTYHLFSDGTGFQNYGLSPSLDIETFHAIRNYLSSPCRRPGQLTCGFNESGDPTQGQVVLEKDIFLFGQKVLARMTLTHASASESFRANKSNLSERQKFLTTQADANFFGGLREADIVIYNGHSRHGGGPDFNPPVLDSKNEPNYDGFYKVKRPGLRRALSEMKSRKDKDLVLGIFSCFSQSYYQDALLSFNSRQKMALSVAEVDYIESLKSSVGFIEGSLRGTCGSDLSTLTTVTAEKQNGYRIFNMGKPPAAPKPAVKAAAKPMAIKTPAKRQD